MSSKPHKIKGVLSAPVVFKVMWNGYAPGDRAWFPIAEATNLIKQQVAERPVDPDEELTAAEPTAAEPTAAKKRAALKAKRTSSKK